MPNSHQIPDRMKIQPITIQMYMVFVIPDGQAHRFFCGVNPPLSVAEK